MNATVLAYNLEPAELKKLKKICAGNGARVRRAAPEDFSQPTGALCGVEKRISPSAPEGGGLDEKLLVLAHFAPRQLDALLAGLRTARVCTDTLKAVLTPANAKWDAYRLCAQLQRERQASERLS